MNLNTIFKNKKLLIGIGIIGILLILIIVILKRQNILKFEDIPTTKSNITSSQKTEPSSKTTPEDNKGSGDDDTPDFQKTIIDGTKPNTTLPKVEDTKDANKQSDETKMPDPTGTQPVQYDSKGEKVEMSGELKGCNAQSGDLVGYCMDAVNCCGGTAGSTAKCLCSHPLVSKCKSEYDACMNDQDILKFYTTEQRLKKCTEQVKGCCSPYGSVKGDASKFEPPIKANQKNDLLCALPAVKGLLSKCMELCQTNPDCKAFNTDDDIICNMFSAVNIDKPMVSALTGKVDAASQSKMNYYVKKV